MISISVVKLHHQIRLRIFSCSRMSENHREPEVLEEKVQVVECLDGFGRITSMDFAFGALFKYFTIRFRFISSLSVGHVIFLAVSFTLYMTTARSCNMYNNCPQLFCTLQRFCRWRPLHTWSHHGFCFFRTENIHHVSDVLRIRFHRVSSCRSFNHSAQK